MTLLELLHKNSISWPEGALYIVQDNCGTVKYSKNPFAAPRYVDGIWDRHGKYGNGNYITTIDLSDDHATAVITPKMFESSGERKIESVRDRIIELDDKLIELNTEREELVDWLAKHRLQVIY